MLFIAIGWGVGCQSSRPESEWSRLFSTADGAMPSPVDVGAIPRHEQVDLRHRVSPGETFFSIGRRYGVPAQQILALNPGIRPETLEVGRSLVLPASASVETKPALRSVRP